MLGAAQKQIYFFNYGATESIIACIFAWSSPKAEVICTSPCPTLFCASVTFVLISSGTFFS